VRRRVQISFLSIFLTLLTVAFAAALAVKMRSYSGRPAAAETTESSTGSSPATERTAGGAGAATTFVPLSGEENTAPGAAVKQSTSVSSPSTATTRAQRFRELLAMGVPKSAAPAHAPAPAPTKPVVAPPPAQKPPSLISKIVQPIVNAFRPSAPAAVTTQPSSGNNNKPPATATDPRDPNSDTTPPQLLTINFDPPQVQDGSDSMLVVTATDDLSGIRGISGTLVNPSGKGIQGFALQREGETTRYTTRIHIQEKAEEGVWKVSFLTLSDLATNTVTLSAAQGTLPPTATLKVISSASDSTPPTVQNVWLERRAMRAGEHNTLFVDAQDEKSGVHLVAAVFLSPAKLARFGVGCRKGSSDTWECDILPSQCIDCGDWTLEQVQLQDNANNFATVRAENPAVAALRLNITGESCDNTPPALLGLALSRTEIVMGRDEPVIEVTAQVTDDGCGIDGVSGQIVGPGSSSSGTFFSLQQREGNTFVGTVRLHPNSARGVWRLQSLTVSDKGKNLKIYYANDPQLARAVFTVK
jgi:hypothetical protein